MQEENEKSQTSLEKKFDPQGALKSHPGFYEQHLKGGPNLKAVEAWLGAKLPKED